MTSTLPEQIPDPNPHFVNQVTVLDTAMAAVRRARADGHQATVVFGGGPGIGKTAAALVLAERARELYPDGRLFARLNGDLDDDGIEAAILGDFLQELGEGRADLPDRLDARRARFHSLTRDKRLMVLLDGVVRAGQVRMLVPGGAGSLVIVTEAQPLGTLAAHGPATFLDLAPLEDTAALALFERVLGETEVARNRAAIEEIIQLCDQLPLALTVVAALLRRFPQRPAERLLRDLRDERRRVRALSRGDDVSVAAAFNLAKSRLNDTALACYHATGAQPGSGTWSAGALATALKLPEIDVEDGLRDLAEARLAEELTGERYLVRDLVRLHARDTDPAEPEERERRSERLLRHWFDGTVAADQLIAPARPWRARFLPAQRLVVRHADREAAWQWLHRERANLRAAVEYAYSVGEDALVARWCVVLWPFYESGKLLDELLATHQLGRAAAERLGDAALASLLATQAGFAHYLRREVDEAITAFDSAVDQARETGDRELEASAVEGLGLALHTAGRLSDARDQLSRNLELATAIDHPRRIALARMHLAKALPPEAALPLLDQAGSHFDAHRETVNAAKTKTWRGIKHLEAGALDDAERALAHALAVMAQARRRFDEAVALEALGDVAASAGRPELAHERYSEALTIFEDLRFALNSDAVRGKLRVVGNPDE
ncbi:NB-ARC domain-containing protein [Amycolatopsis magusensis]|uniref:NB-ARC domain-containing protein n=1 Tax=Amycolatopsis magusensis TaxID=882444 RepID=UPI0037920950